MSESVYALRPCAISAAVGTDPETKQTAWIISLRFSDRPELCVSLGPDGPNVLRQVLAKMETVAAPAPAARGMH